MAPDLAPAPTPGEAEAEAESKAEMNTLEVDPKMHHSDLEVDNRKHFSDPEVVRLGYSDMEVMPGFGMLEGMQENNLQAYHPRVAGDKAASGAILYHSGNQEPEMKIPVDGEDVPASEDRKGKRRICKMAPRIFWMFITAMALLIVGAAVGGAVGVTQTNKRSQASAATSTTDSSPGSASTSGGTPTSTTSVDRGIRPDSQLAALAWTVSSTRYQYRVYYQDTDNSLKESAYDSSSGSWSVSKILNGSNVMPGTYLAASARKQAEVGSDAVDINVYFFDTDSKLSVISATLGVWNTSRQSISEATYGTITAYYNDCDQCSNTTLVSLASKGVVTVYNHTASEPWNDEKGFLISDGALKGSAVSLQPYSIASYADQVNIYYQRSDGYLVIVSWFSNQYQTDKNLDLSATGGWSYNASNSVVGSMAANASFATLGFGDDNGSPAYGEVVTSGTNWDGIQVYEWTSQSWHAATKPDALQDVTRYTAIAAHSYQRVYALAGGVLTQYAVDNKGIWSINAGHKVDVVPQNVTTDGMRVRFEVRGQDIGKLHTRVYLDNPVTMTIERTDRLQYVFRARCSSALLTFQKEMDVLLASEIVGVNSSIMYDSKASPLLPAGAGAGASA